MSEQHPSVTGGRRRWLGLVVISLAVALIIVDSTIVNVAIPSIIDDLDISSTQVQWVQESYTLVFAALLLVFGTLADQMGTATDADHRHRRSSPWRASWPPLHRRASS